MSLEWRSSYHAAMSEQDPANRTGACERARHDINSRLLELAGRDTGGSADATRDERAELEEALRQITMHEWKNDEPQA